LTLTEIFAITGCNYAISPMTEKSNAAPTPAAMLAWRDAPWGLSDWKQQGGVFLLALVVRVAVGWFFFGSVDFTNTLLNNLSLAAGQHTRMEMMPYFPVIAIFTWLGGALNLWTDWPLAFCYKLVPIFCDALIAVVIYDILRARRSGLAFGAGLLYACAPVPVIITCIQGQWDSIVLLLLLLAFHFRENFCEGRWNGFLFGAFFMASFLVKPFAVMFAPLFFQPCESVGSKTAGFRHGVILACVFVPVFLVLNHDMPVMVVVGMALAYVFVLLTVINALARLRMPDKRRYMRRHLAAFTGLMFVALLMAVVFHHYGYSIHGTIHRIYVYSKTGVQIFGLPFAYPFSALPQIFKMRLWILPVIAIILLFYYLGRISALDALLAGFALILGTAGLSPQYLMWLVPLLLTQRRLRVAAVYTVLATGFLLYCYANPQSSYIAGENMNSLTTLKHWQWLMPSLDYSSPKLLVWIRMVGNYAIPIFSLALFAMIFVPLVRNKGGAESVGQVSPSRPPFKPWRVLHVWLVSILGIMILIGSLAFRNSVSEQALENTLLAKSADYAFEPTNTSNSLMVLADPNTKSLPWIGAYPPAGAGSILNIINVGLTWAVVWAASAIALALSRSPTAKKVSLPQPVETKNTHSGSL
jgi:hypothetical protein